jgi:ABC-2 type transport system permease protein
MVPLLVLVLAIGSGARAFAGEEDAGRLELPLSYPVRRRDAVLAKGAGIAVEVLVLCAGAVLALVLLDPVFGLDLAFAHVVGALAGVAALGILHGWLALAVGAAVPRRGLALGIPAGLAAAGYLVGGLHDLAGWLDPFRFASASWWLGSGPLQNGVDVGGVLVVLAAAAAVLAAATLLVERRDLTVP